MDEEAHPALLPGAFSDPNLVSSRTSMANKPAIVALPKKIMPLHFLVVSTRHGIWLLDLRTLLDGLTISFGVVTWSTPYLEGGSNDFSAFLHEV